MIDLRLRVGGSGRSGSPWRNCLRAPVTPLLRPPLTPLFDDIEQRTFNYFWETADPETGLIPDRYPYTEPFSSIAAVGFALTA